MDKHFSRGTHHQRHRQGKQLEIHVDCAKCLFRGTLGGREGGREVERGRKRERERDREREIKRGREGGRERKLKTHPHTHTHTHHAHARDKDTPKVHVPLFNIIYRARPPREMLPFHHHELAFLSVRSVVGRCTLARSQLPCAATPRGFSKVCQSDIQPQPPAASGHSHSTFLQITKSSFYRYGPFGG